MKKKIIYFAGLCITSLLYVGDLYAQGVSISDDAAPPDPSAMFDVQSHATNGKSGILFPRFDLSTGTWNALPATHLFGVNTNSGYSGNGGGLNSGIGLYRYDGENWNRLLEAPDAKNFWGTSGNDIKTGDFIGTTNPQALIFKVNGTTRMTIPSPGLEDMVIQNVRALQLPGNTKFPATPSLRFSTATNSGIYGVGANKIGISTTTRHFFFAPSGLAIDLNPREPEPNTTLDVNGNIYTREKIIYSQYHGNTQPRTGKVERYWSGTVAVGGTTGYFYTSTDTGEEIRFQIKRTGSGYTVQIEKYSNSSEGPRYFVSSYLSNDCPAVCGPVAKDVEAQSVSSGTNFGPPADLTDNIVGALGDQATVLVAEKNYPDRPTYRITVFFNGDGYLRILTGFITITKPSSLRLLFLLCICILYCRSVKMGI
ncbi:MAG: hypothetical protein M9887_12050 [Chitinophagales bacterium]|nr:hypothetical protein [Chitinophagales bacterium]